jgi:hypothetical protein
LRAHGQFAGVLETNSRYGGNSAGTGGYSGDTGMATATSLSAPSYVVFDSVGNLYVSDTANNCVRKIDTGGNISTVAGLRVNGGADTCNSASNPTPAADQGLLRPAGLAIDSANTLYIADSQHNCVRSLAFGAVDSYAANALTTAAGSCGSVDTASTTPVPNGLAVDANMTLYISLQDNATASPVNQVVRHLATDPLSTVCLLAGLPSANVSNACPGLLADVTISSPAGVALDANGNLFVADTGNNCVREIVGLTTPQTVVGLCSNDHTGTSGTALRGPYGLSFSPSGLLYISEAAVNANNVVSFNSATGALAMVAGLAGGAPGPYSALLDGQAATAAPLDQPLGLTTDAIGNIYLADSLNNVIREMGTGLIFGSGAVGSAVGTQTVTIGINQPVNLSTSTGPDFSISSNTCSGPFTPAIQPTTCQVIVRFTPSRPGARTSSLTLRDSMSGNLISVALTGTGIGPLSLFTPGNVSSFATNLRNPIAVSVDSAGDAYVLEQADASTSADVLLFPAGGGSPQAVVPQGDGLQTPTAMAVDGAGNIFVADAATGGITRFGADGTVNSVYVTGLENTTAIAVDEFDNLYVAQSGTVHNVIKVFAGGTTVVLAGSGTTPNADGVAASNALFVSPSSLALGPNGLSIADSGGHRVYTIDGSGTIHLVAGNGTTTTTSVGQALGTALLTPVGLAADAAGDLYISDQAANRIYEAYATTSNGANMGTVLGTGAAGYTGDGGPGPLATLQAQLAVALDSSDNLFVVDAGNDALRKLAYPVTTTLNFGDIIIGTTSHVKVQSLANAGNTGLNFNQPFTTTDGHFAVVVDPATTTCSSAVASGGVCSIGYTFSPTALGPLTAQSNLLSNSYNSPQTIQLTGYGLYTQNLPYSLSPETEVYGQPFTETSTVNLVYPDLIPTGTMTYTIAGETTCTISGSFPGTTNCQAASSGLGVGTYTVNFTYTTGDLSYFSTTGTTTLTITPGLLSVTPANVTKAYGAAIPALPATVTGAVNGDLFLASDTTTATASSPVGQYPITPTLTAVGLSSLHNYSVTYNIGTLTITPLPLTVTVNNATRVYGAANPTFTGTVSGGINGDTFTVTYSSGATANTPVGTYPITATVTGANLSNYTVIVVPGALTITPAPLTVTVGNASRAYGAANPAFTSTISGALNGDTFTNNYSTTATVASPVGMYPITDTLGGPAAANYAVTVVPGVLTITPATGTLNIAANNATRAYGAANPPFTSTITGALNGDTFTVTYATAATATSPVGTYAIVPTVSGAALSNYSTVTTTNGTLTVTPAALNVAVANATRQYGAANPAFTSNLTGLLNGDSVTVVYSTTATVTSPVGTYPITATISGAAASNYTVTLSAGTLTVTQAPLTVTVANATRQYGAANPVFTSTIAGALNGDSFTNTYSTTATVASPVGTYPVSDVLSGPAAGNYAITVVPGTLTITQATGVLTIAANNASRAYGAANPAFTGTVTGGLNGDTFTITFATTATTTSAVGSYAIVPTVSGAALSNYATVVTTNGTLTVTPATLTVTVAGASRAYGAANPTFSGTIGGGINGDSFTVTYSSTATVTSPVGSYPITATVAGADIANYTVTVVPGTLTVTPAALTVTVASASRVYGAANPAFTGTVTGALNGDTFTTAYSTAATVTSPVGTYPITATVSGPAAANYAVTVVPGTLTITQAVVPLTVTANNASRVYGAANPAFTSTVTGALNGDTFTITYTTTATAGSPIGTYPIVPVVSGAAAGNYAIVPVNGTLTITPAALSVAANNATRMYGAANPVFTGTITGLVNGDAINVTYATTATVTSPVGTYAIVPTVTGAALSNYTLTTANGTLTVTQSVTPLTVTVNNATRAYGAANPTFTGTVTGLLNGDSVTVTYASAATASSPAGTYPITATVTGAAVANYTLTVVPGTLTITPAATTTAITTSSGSFVTGNSVTFTVTVTSAGGVPTGNVDLYSGTTLLSTSTLSASGVATFSTSTFTPGSYTIVANYDGSNNFAPSTATLTQLVSAGTFILTANPPTQFIRGPGSTVYTVTVASVQNFSGPIALTCTGLPADSSCVFTNPTLTLTVGGTASTTMTVVNTEADAKVSAPKAPGRGTALGFAPITIAAVLPFELTGFGVFVAGLFGKKRRARTASARGGRMRLALLVLATVSLVGLAGCACFTSLYQNYTITITGTSSAFGTTPQSASVALTVAPQ